MSTFSIHILVSYMLKQPHGSIVCKLTRQLKQYKTRTFYITLCFFNSLGTIIPLTKIDLYFPSPPEVKESIPDSQIYDANTTVWQV